MFTQHVSSTQSHISKLNHRQHSQVKLDGHSFPFWRSLLKSKISHIMICIYLQIWSAPILIQYLSKSFQQLQFDQRTEVAQTFPISKGMTDVLSTLCHLCKTLLYVLSPHDTALCILVIFSTAGTTEYV